MATSCSLSIVVSQQPAQPLAALDLACRPPDFGTRLDQAIAEALADVIGNQAGATAVAGAIRNFRNRVKRAMLVEANIAIDPVADLIVNDRQHGYRTNRRTSSALSLPQRVAATTAGGP